LRRPEGRRVEIRIGQLGGVESRVGRLSRRDGKEKRKEIGGKNGRGKGRGEAYFVEVEDQVKFADVTEEGIYKWERKVGRLKIRLQTFEIVDLK